MESMSFLLFSCINTYSKCSYDDSKVAFIATKTDEVSASEIIRNLGLREKLDPDILEIESKVANTSQELQDSKIQKESTEKKLKGKLSVCH
jgi:hypothetical protein